MSSIGCVSDSQVMPDSGVPDTSTVMDTGVDVVTDAGTSFCTGKTFDFCADFDLVSAPELGWSLGKSEKMGGTITLDQTSYVSPPHAAVSRLPLITNSTAYSTAGTVQHVLDLKGKTRARMTVDVYPKGPPGFLVGECLSYLGLQLNGIGGIVMMQRRTSDAGPTEWVMYRSMTTMTAPHFMTSGLALSKWNHVVEEVNWASDTTGSIKVTIDGTVALDVPAIATTQETMPQTVRPSVGLNNCLGASQLTSVSYDNVFVELLP
jgi:hypothetical protein